MYRRQIEAIEKDLEKKMVFLVGPRQVGKTWISKNIAQKFKHAVYLNYDSATDREIIRKEAWLSETDLLVLDEIHKMPQWKNYLKGVFDTKPASMKILVTGSARFDTFRESGDSLAGRFFLHRILPISLGEVAFCKEKYNLQHLLERGGFPEPLLAETNLEAERWRLQYVDGLIKNDVWHLEGIMDFRALNTLIELLKNAVGSTISYTNLAQDLQVAPNTVKKYIEVLESAYLIFKVTPYSKNIARALLKEPKIYFYDYPLVSDAGARLENFVAVSLLKEVLARQDYGAQAASLHYIRTKDGKEVDFCICMGSEVEKIIEVKSSDSHIQPNLRYFSKRYGWPGLQLVADLKREYVEENIEVRQLDKVLQGYF